MIDAGVHTKFWRDLVTAPTSSIFPMILGSILCLASRIWLIIVLSRGKAAFSSSIAATTAEETRHRGVCAVIPVRIHHSRHCHSPMANFQSRGELMGITNCHFVSFYPLFRLGPFCSLFRLVFLLYLVSYQLLLEMPSVWGLYKVKTCVCFNSSINLRKLKFLHCNFALWLNLNMVIC